MLEAQLEPETLAEIVHQPIALSEADLRTIAQVAFLAAEIDFDEDPDERPTLDALVRALAGIVGIAPRPIDPVSPLPLDSEERVALVRELAGRLRSPAARELAYVAAYLLVLADLAIVRIETTLLAELQAALAIDDARARELVARITAAVTPVAV